MSPVLGVSVTQQVSFLDNYLAQYIPPVAPSNAPNYLTGHVPRKLSNDEIFEVYVDNLTADVLLDNDKETSAYFCYVLFNIFSNDYNHCY